MESPVALHFVGQLGIIQLIWNCWRLFDVHQFVSTTSQMALKCLTRSRGTVCGSTFCWKAWYHSVDLKLLEAFWCPPVRLHNVSNKSQMKNPTMFQRYVSTAYQYYVSTTSPVNPKLNIRWRRCGTFSPRLRVSLLWPLASRSPPHFQIWFPFVRCPRLI